MTVEIFSRHIGAASELLLAADVKPGFVPFRATTTHASRLRIFLRLINALRMIGVDGLERGTYVGPIDRLRTLHYVRWTLFDDDKRMLLAVNFDHPIEPYLRRIVDDAGPLLDCILCHCEGYAESSTDLGYAGFLSFGQRHQIDVDLFSASRPDVTIDDMSYLSALERLQRETRSTEEFEQQAARYRLRTPGRRAHDFQQDPEILARYQLQSLRILRAMHYTSRYFPAPEAGHPGSDDPTMKDHLFYMRHTQALLEGFDPSLVPEDVLRPFLPALAWGGFMQEDGSLAPLPLQPLPKPEHREPDLANVQGGIVSAYRSAKETPLTMGALLTVRLDGRAAAGAFLERMAKIVTPGNAKDGDQLRINVGLTIQGLKTLGLAEAERLRFPTVFREGMAKRAGMIGDVGLNHPENWRPRHTAPDGSPGDPLHLDTVDAVVFLQAGAETAPPDLWTDKHPLAVAFAEAMGGLDGYRILSADCLNRQLDANNRAIGHFGYADGISQPKVGEDGRDGVTAGAMLMGYGTDATEDVPDLLYEGSYMVIRKLRQDVEAFEAAAARAPDAEEFYAKVMGRTRAGIPLVAPNTENDFDFSSDVEGEVCPFSAHIRRANPRQVPGMDPVDHDFIHQPMPRIMRRGYSYGPRGSDSETDRGLMFVCYNASIAEQFEVIQRWIAGGNSTGVLSAQNDPMLGPMPATGTRTFRYIRQIESDGDARQEIERVDLGNRPFVTLQWGQYVFMPSLTALRTLSKTALSGVPAANPDTMADQGRAIVAALLARSAPVGDWKLLLEDGDARNREKADAIYAHIRRDHAGVLDAGPFVFVTAPEHVMAVYRDPKAFSVREYWKRMQSSVGGVFLGMDPEPQPLAKLVSAPKGSPDDLYETEVPGQYAATSGPVNPFLGAFNPDTSDAKALRARTFDRVFQIVKFGLSQQVPDERDPATGGRRRLIDMEVLIGSAISTFGLAWLGIPAGVVSIHPHLDKDQNPVGPDVPRSPFDFVETATFLFGPWPTEDAKARADHRGERLICAVKRYIEGLKSEGKKPPEGTLLGHLMARTEFPTDELARLLVGSGLGLHTPTTGSFTGVAFDWLKEKTYWRHQQDLLAALRAGMAPREAAMQALSGPMLHSMAKYAAPKLLHRVAATKDARIGVVDVPPGKQVVLALGSAAQQAPEMAKEILFGGVQGGTGDVPVHACPGREAALTVMLATMAALMVSGELTENSPLTAYLRTPEGGPDTFV